MKALRAKYVCYGPEGLHVIAQGGTLGRPKKYRGPEGRHRMRVSLMRMRLVTALKKQLSSYVSKS